MIVTEIYNGQGLGNQLWCYVTTRVIAKDHGYDFGIKSPEKFKCNDFLELDFGLPVNGGSGPEGGPPLTLPEGIDYYYNERRINHPDNGVDIRTYDNNLVTIPDRTKIDGVMQDEQYIYHRKDEIREWLKVRPEFECFDYANDDVCIINFRGGEYTTIKNVFLPQSYWDNAVRHMRTINTNFRFIVITDDVTTAKRFFPEFDVFHYSISKDYVIIKNAHYLILSNSSFACLPAWLNKNLKLCIAPKYWSQYNFSDGYWGCSYNIINNWLYLGRDGKFYDSKSCKQEFSEYVTNHQKYFQQPTIKKSFLVVSDFQNDISWVPDWTSNYILYDKGETSVYPPKIDRKKVQKTINKGYNLSDYFTYIIDNYDQLPECVIFTKGNIFPRHISEYTFAGLVNNEFFTPLEDFRLHKTHWPVSFIGSDGGYNEINNSWYVEQFPTKFFNNYNDFLRFCFVDPVIPRYIRFAPGGCYIVPKANILKLPREFYRNLRTIVSHDTLTGEAHIVERALHTLWTSNFEIHENMKKPIDVSMFRLTTNQTTFRNKFSKKLVRIVERIMEKFVV